MGWLLVLMWIVDGYFDYAGDDGVCVGVVHITGVVGCGMMAFVSMTSVTLVAVLLLVCLGCCC